MIKNMLLVVFSVLFVVVFSIVADRVLGAARRPPGLPQSLELIFPPHSEQHFETIDFSYSVYINSLGFRGGEPVRERGNVFRIIAIGDSYTYGWGVDIEDSWPFILERKLRDRGKNVEILNLGKPGAGPPYYAELAETAIPLLRPDLTLVCMLQGNDLRAAGPETPVEATPDMWARLRAVYPNFVLLMRDLRREREYAGRTHQDMPPQKSSAEDNRNWTANTAREFLENMPPEHRARFDAFDEGVKDAFLSGNLNPYMIDLAMQNTDFYTVAVDPDDSWTVTCIERTAGHFSAIRRLAEEYGSEVMVVSIPEGPYVNRHALNNMRRVGYTMPEWLLTTDGADEGIRRAAAKAGTPFHDVSAVFREHQDDPGLYFELDGHPTARGNKLFAEAFMPIIEGHIPE